MSWSTAATDLRILLSDGDTDRYGYRKKCFGSVDGLNKSFKSFDNRRVTDFTDSVASASPLGVYLDGVRVATGGISSDSPITGEFIIVAAPTGSQVVEASYYYQWFLDAELTQFLTSASEWLGLSTDYSSVPEGLRPSAKYYAAQEAMHKMAARWAEKMSQQYQVEDAPAPKNQGVVESYRKLAEDYKKKSVELRDQYYTRQGQSLQPLFKSNAGVVSSNVPKR